MPKTTDQNLAGAMSLDEPTAAVLVAVAEHFRSVRPTDALECTDLLVCVGAEAYNFVGRRLDGSSALLAEAALAAMPHMFGGITRGEAVFHVRATVVAAGHDWPDGDNDPAIPRIPGIPGQRSPQAAAVEVEPYGSLTCCGRPMGRQGTQWVCGVCGSWVDLGLSSLGITSGSAEGASV
ncbi:MULTISPECIES: hypothetical protein [unclassified Streptomyces]|uniref:hypothetical protein n=1 Tax=unclassified Streptomyces TaxID=2593676 RepID=UPI00093FB505|nr:hypothetical protein [Streptomyces sp. TSRI0281]OKI34988.1 hypothetical protein A6A29_16315 [Streptomyces sp. TSRI0281]